MANFGLSPCLRGLKSHLLSGRSIKHFLDLKQKGGNMGEIVHTSRIKIVREKGPTRRAMIEGFNEPVFYGVHGGIKRFYKVEPEKEHAATLDHIVAATAG
jgi:hypothetical protein